MTDSPGVPSERPDPVLVRPYVTDDPSEEEDPVTWPASSGLPDDLGPRDPFGPEDLFGPDDSVHGEAPDGTTAELPATTSDTAELPAAAQLAGTAELAGTAKLGGTAKLAGTASATAPPETPVGAGGRKTRGDGPSLPLRLMILVGGLVLALGVGAFVVFGNQGDDDAKGPSTVLPQVTDTLTDGGAPAAASHGTPSKSASASPSPSKSASPSASVSTSATPSTSASPSADAGPSATLQAPPSSDRSGRITAAGGNCLTLGGLFGISGSPVTVSGCVGGDSQTFTLSTDGTLRVSGSCAQVTGDATVHITTCGSGTAMQWRIGPHDSLVNPASSTCLTDPSTVGATTKATTCDGSSQQTWSAP